MQGVQVTFTVDTGATTTILSNKIYKKIPEDQRPRIKKDTTNFHDLVGAGGNSLNFQGRGTFEIHLGPLRLEKELSVAEISDEVLLGADILQHDEDGPVDLILSQSLMICRGISIPVQQVGTRPKIRHARVADHYIIPGMSQMNVDVFVDPEDENCAAQNLVLVEPKPELAEQYSVVVGRTLLDMSSHATGKVLIMNQFDWPVSLKQDTVVGYVEEIEDPPTILSAGMEDHTGPGVPQGTAISLTGWRPQPVLVTVLPFRLNLMGIRLDLKYSGILPFQWGIVRGWSPRPILIRISSPRQSLPVRELTMGCRKSGMNV